MTTETPTSLNGFYPKQYNITINSDQNIPENLSPFQKPTASPKYHRVDPTFTLIILPKLDQQCPNRASMYRISTFPSIVPNVSSSNVALMPES